MPHIKLSFSEIKITDLTSFKPKINFKSNSFCSDSEFSKKKNLLFMVFDNFYTQIGSIILLSKFKILEIVTQKYR